MQMAPAATICQTASRNPVSLYSRPRIARIARCAVASAAVAAPAVTAAPAFARPLQTASVDCNSAASFLKLAASDLLSASKSACPSRTPLPPATGRAQPVCMVVRHRVTYHAGVSTSWRADKTCVDLNAQVHACLAGMRLKEVQEIVDIYFSSFELAGADVMRNMDTSPATAAARLSCLASEWAHVLSLVAPGGSSALVKAKTGLRAVTEAAAAAATRLSAAGSFHAAFAVGAAGLELLSHLSFGSSIAAAPYLEAALAFKAAITVAVSSGDVAVTERDVLTLTAACARAHNQLHLTPWFGHAFGKAAESMLRAGWSSGEAALQYAEAWCTMVASSRLQFVSDKYRVLVEAVLSHPGLTAAQLDRLLATERTLPAYATSGVKEWLAAWEKQVRGRRERLTHTAACAAVQRLSGSPALVHAGSGGRPRSAATLQQLSC